VTAHAAARRLSVAVLVVTVMGCGSATLRATPRDLLKESGTADPGHMEHVTEPFDAGPGWILSYSYDCTLSTAVPLFEAFVKDQNGLAVVDTGMQSAVKGTQQARVNFGGQGLTIDLYAGPNCVWAVIASQ